MKTRLFSILAIIMVIVSACAQVSDATAPASPQIAQQTSTPPQIPSQTPNANVYLSELIPESVKTGNDPWVTGASSLGIGEYPFYYGPDVQIHKGDPLQASNNSTFPDGLLAFASSELVYTLNGQYTTFETTIFVGGFSECQGDGAKFLVLLDDTLIYESPTMVFDTGPAKIAFDVRGAQKLTLKTDRRANPTCDFTIWGDPRLLSGEEYVVTIKTDTPNLNIPCGEVTLEKVYLFLDCNDIRRIREQIKTGSPEVKKAWDDLQISVDNYLFNFPTKLDPDESYDTLWWGAGNYIARDMALVYLVTGDVRYAEGIIKLLELITATIPNNNHLVNFEADVHAPSYASGGLMSHPGYGEVVYQSTLFGYLAIRDNGLLGNNDKEKFDAFFINQAFLLEEASKIIGNRSALDSTGWRNAAVGPNIAAATIAVAFPQDEKLQELYTRVREHVNWQFANWWEQDGGWGENTEGYGYRVMEGLLLFSEALLRNRGENLYTQNFDGRTLNLLCNYYTRIMVPEGTVPAINDSAYYTEDPGLFILCGYRTQDPILSFTFQQYLWGKYHGFGNNVSGWDTLFHVIVWAGLEAKDAPTPEYTSTLLPATGLAILRDGWSHTSQYMLLKFTASKIHAHFNFGDFYLYDNGPWLVSNAYQDFYDQSIRTDNHSTLSLDGTNQTQLGGDLVVFADLNQVGIAGATSHPYNNMQHTRIALWNKTWHQWIVVDDASVTDEKPHTLQQRWYVRGTPISMKENIWQFSRRANSDTLEITLLPNLPAKYTAISRAYNIDTQIASAKGVQMDVSYPGHPLRLISSMRSTTSNEQSPTIVRTDSNSGTMISSQLDGTEWIWILSNPFNNSGNISGYEIEGTAGCIINKNNLLQDYCLMNGKSLSKSGVTFVASDQPINLEANTENKTIIIEVIKDSQINLYWPSKVIEILENNMSIPYNFNNNTLTINLLSGRHILNIRP
jgi:hypothetical protein